MSEHAHRGGEWSWRTNARAIQRRCPWPAAVALGLALAGALAIAMLQGEKPFFTDAGGYWQLGTTFTANGHFSLLNFHDEIKGYFFPLITHGLQALDSDLQWTASSIVKLFNVLLFAVIGTVLGPALVRTVWPTRPSWGLWRRLTLTGLLLVFWSGFLNFPMSDFPALAAALLTLVAVARVDSPGWMLLAGAALAATIDIRESYIFFLPAVLAIVVWAWFDQRGGAHASARHRVLCAGLFVLAFAVVSLPQSLSAHRYHNSWSFIPGVSVKEPAGEFYASGIAVGSYDTYVYEGGAVVEMKYYYPAGRRLLAEQPEGKITSTSQYLSLYASHPWIMANVIVRHVINGLDPLYSTPYVEDLHNAGRTWGRIAVLWPAARRRLGPGRLRFLLALLVCCVTTVPTQMERRYMLPVYLVVYLLALTPSWPNPMGQAGTALRRLRTPAVIAVVFIGYAAVIWYITGDAISHLTFVDGITHQVLVPQ
jgi:hypothetical protein